MSCCSLGAARFAITGYRHGNADLRSAQPAAGGRREGPRPPGWLPSRRGPQQRRWRAGKGTPTSGQFSRWGPAQPAAGGRAGRTPTPRMAPLSAWTPAAQVARRQGNADLWPVLPVGAGTARRRRADGKDPVPPDGSPLGVDPSSAGGAQARERRPLASSPGGGRHSGAQSAADGVDAEWRHGAHRGHDSIRRSGVPPGQVGSEPEVRCHELLFAR